MLRKKKVKCDMEDLEGDMASRAGHSLKNVGQSWPVRRSTWRRGGGMLSKVEEAGSRLRTKSSKAHKARIEKSREAGWPGGIARERPGGDETALWRGQAGRGSWAIGFSLWGRGHGSILQMSQLKIREFKHQFMASVTTVSCCHIVSLEGLPLSSVLEYTSSLS